MDDDADSWLSAENIEEKLGSIQLNTNKDDKNKLNSSQNSDSAMQTSPRKNE